MSNHQVSSSKIRKATGTKIYDSSSKIFKREVNATLVSLVEKVISCTDVPTVWSFLLDTGKLQSVQALLNSCSRALPCYTVVPNPDGKECQSMKAVYPTLRVHHTTSHALIPILCDHTSAVAKEMRQTGWKGFSYVWLDYCGTFQSRAGKERQGDVTRLFKECLLNRHGCVLSLTFSQRGTMPLYQHELVDTIVSFTCGTAAQNG